MHTTLANPIRTTPLVLSLVIILIALMAPRLVFSQPDRSGGNGTRSTVDSHGALAKELLLSNADSALYHALEAEKRSDELSSLEEKAQVLILVGDAYQSTSAMPEALQAYQRAQLLIEDAIRKDGAIASLVLARSDIQLKIGVLHFQLRNFDQSLSCYNDALRLLEATSKDLPSEELANRKVRAFNNIAAVYIQRSDFATALPYFEQAVAINRPLNNLRNEGSLNNNIGICHMELGKYDLANQFFLKALAVRKEAGDARGQAQVLNNLGKNQTKVGNFQAAREYFDHALMLGRESGSRESMVISLESLSLVYDTLQNYKAAVETFREFKTLNDSLYSAESRTTIARLEDGFRRDKEKKVFELEAKRKDAENERQRIWNIALATVAFFLLLTAFLIYKVMRARVLNGALEQERLHLEQEKLEAEQTILKESLDYKDRELTANALFLLKKNELIAHIAERLLKAKSTFKQENQKIVQDIVRDLQNSQDEHNWEEFEAHFTRVHSTFYQTLKEQFPALSPNERKLCAFLRLNMSTKDISAITHQSLNSITVARSRLRKKLNIEGEDVHLIDFLQSI
ncbi:MAG: tetratricopeptide repeat protein [Flavobacteriales bacterium]|nr:tetratricopeptide repeat protein [Flavobacteriales bacterium]MBK6943676.1 tetratricopeptide repeat protein [Flavobacteriales bacterium]MBK7239888.1 tetratricopeptide repeat protein [Flavobacteriales bacterium]MBK7296929.1 tetratricopeptide repeat protein [Flavobacteriales bacterium]MBK9535791.1 tetratricopeptide repeat protein [Flavobacteriales bacterium]